MTDEELLALPQYETSPLFRELDRLVIAYVDGMSRTPVDVPAGLVEQPGEHFSDTQIVELTHLTSAEGSCRSTRRR